MRRALLLCASLAVSTSSMAQPTPLPARGHGVVSATTSVFTSRAGWDDDGVAIPEPDVSLRSLALEAALLVGVGERLSLTARAPFMAVAGTDAAGSVAMASGPGDAVIGLILDDGGDGPLRLALRGDVKLPLYAGPPALQGRLPSPSDPRVPGTVPALGDGQVDVTVAGLLVAMFPFGGFFTWELGYRFRTGGVTDGVTGAGRVALPTPEWLLGGRLVPRWDHAFLFSFDPAVDGDGLPIEVVGRSLVVTGPGCQVLLPELWSGLALDVGAALLFRGRNAAGGVRFDVGVIHAF